MTATGNILRICRRSGSAPTLHRRTRRRYADRAGCPRERVRRYCGYLKNEVERPYRMLYDLTAIDERVRKHRDTASRQRLHRRVSPVLVRAQRRRPAEGGAAAITRSRWTPSVRHLAERQLVRARSVGHVRHRVQRAIRTCDAS